MNQHIPLYLQIYQDYLQEIRLGKLLPGSKLPSQRNLANELGVSRNTVNMAYEQLVAEGYIEAREKKGFFVANIDGVVDLSPKDYSEEIIEEQKKTLAIEIDFSPFGIDLEHAPYGNWKKLTKEVILDQGEQIFVNGHPQGEESLRRALQEYLHQSRGVNCDIAQIIVGAGTDYLLMLLTRLLPKEQKVFVEDPVYMQAYRVFENFQYNVIPVGLDENGINMEKIMNQDGDLCFVTPSHQFPTGISMPIQRRLQLLNWASQREGRYIIEDDYDGEFRYQGKPIPSLQGIDNRDKVIYMGTLSKAIAPSIRMGYMVLPKTLLKQYYKVAGFYATTVPRLEQELVTRFIREGYFQRHLNRMRNIYRNKHDCLIHALEQYMPSIAFYGQHAGLHFVLHIKSEQYNEEELIQKARNVGVGIYSMKQYCIQEQVEDIKFLLGYAKLQIWEIEEGIQRLKQAWEID